MLLCGDFNARTGSEPDNIDPKGNEHVFGQNPLSLTKNLPPRNNLDQTVNKTGRELVHGNFELRPLGERYTYATMLRGVQANFAQKASTKPTLPG